MKSGPVKSAVLHVALSVALSAPAWAVSVPAPAPAVPDQDTTQASVAGGNLVAGSASLIPLMAAEMEANHVSYVDAVATTSGGAAPKAIDDIAFVRQATESGRKEVDSARDALPQLKQPELKQIAEMLVNDHSGANARLAKIAETKRWPIPSPQTLEPPASGTASGDFDARWTAEMIAGHERSVALYRAQAAGGEDKDLRNYARETLPTIERHLAELRRLQK